MLANLMDPRGLMDNLLLGTKKKKSFETYFIFIVNPNFMQNYMLVSPINEDFWYYAY